MSPIRIEADAENGAEGDLLASSYRREGRQQIGVVQPDAHREFRVGPRGDGGPGYGLDHLTCYSRRAELGWRTGQPETDTALLAHVEVGVIPAPRTDVSPLPSPHPARPPQPAPVQCL